MRKKHEAGAALAPDDRRFRLLLLLLCALCYILHIYGVSRLYSPFLFSEEMGYWTNAATFAGENWSPSIVKSGIPWYSYLYSLTLVPLFWIFDDIVSMYRAAIALNALWATLSMLLCYGVGSRLGKGIGRSRLLVFSFLVSIYSSFLHQSSIAVVETFLYFVVWLSFWLFVRYEESPGQLRALVLSVGVGLCYLAHNRALGIIAAYFLTVLIMLLAKKCRLRDLPALLLPVAAVYVLDRYFMIALSQKIWGISNRSSHDYEYTLRNLRLVLTDVRMTLRLIYDIAGKFWYACTASFMLCLWGVIWLTKEAVRGVREKREYAFSALFFLLAYLAMNAVSAIFTLQFDDAKLQRVDFLIYGRYAECVCGVVMLCGFFKLAELPEKSLGGKAALFMGSYLPYLLATLMIRHYLNGILAMHLEPMIWPNTQVNSTPGIFFYTLLGQFSFVKCAVLSAAASALLFLGWCLPRKGWPARAFGCALLACLFVFTSWKSAKMYTYVHQASNNNPLFTAMTDAIERDYRGSDVFIVSDTFYEYFDVQLRLIHSTVYPGSAGEYDPEAGYDLLIEKTADAPLAGEEGYALYLENEIYRVLVREELLPQD